MLSPLFLLRHSIKQRQTLTTHHTTESALSRTLLHFCETTFVETAVVNRVGFQVQAKSVFLACAKEIFPKAKNETGTLLITLAFYHKENLCYVVSSVKAIESYPNYPHVH